MCSFNKEFNCAPAIEWCECAVHLGHFDLIPADCTMPPHGNIMRAHGMCNITGSRCYVIIERNRNGEWMCQPVGPAIDANTTYSMLVCNKWNRIFRLECGQQIMPLSVVEAKPITKGELFSYKCNILSRYLNRAALGIACL